MKTAVIILCLIVALLLFLLWDTKTSSSVTLRDLEATKRYHVDKANLDSLAKDAYKDSLEMMRLIIANAHEETERAHEQKRKAIAYANSIKPVRYQTDQERDSVLMALYPTIGRP